MEQSDGHFPVQAIRVVGECYCVSSIHQYAHMIAINFRIHQSLIIKYSDKVDSPFEIVNGKLDNRKRGVQHLKLTQSEW